MRKRLLAMIGVAAIWGLATVQPAMAGTEVGNRCAANTSDGPVMYVSLANGGDPLPAVIPSSGVITRWTFSLGLPIEPGFVLFETLKVFRPTGLPQQLQVVGESSPGRIAAGTNSFPTRISVKAGDLIGALAEVPPATGTVFCETGNPGDRVGVIEGPAPAGSTVTITEGKESTQNPIVVIVEPDADGDGFGDETQDQCPQNAAVQAACPPPPLPLPPPALVSLSTDTQVKRGSVTVVVTPSAQATVSVKGVVKLGKGKKGTLNGGTQSLAPGLLGKFRLIFTKKVKTKLKGLPRNRSLRLNVTVTGTNSSGAVTKKTLKVKLKGQAKAKAKAKAKKRASS